MAGRERGNKIEEEYRGFNVKTCLEVPFLCNFFVKNSINYPLLKYSVCGKHHLKRH